MKRWCNLSFVFLADMFLNFYMNPTNLKSAYLHLYTVVPRLPAENNPNLPNKNCKCQSKMEKNWMKLHGSLQTEDKLCGFLEISIHFFLPYWLLELQAANFSMLCLFLIVCFILDQVIKSQMEKHWCKTATCQMNEVNTYQLTPDFKPKDCIVLLSKPHEHCHGKAWTWTPQWAQNTGFKESRFWSSRHHWPTSIWDLLGKLWLWLWKQKKMIEIYFLRKKEIWLIRLDWIRASATEQTKCNLEDTEKTHLPVSWKTTTFVAQGEKRLKWKQPESLKNCTRTYTFLDFLRSMHCWRKDYRKIKTKWTWCSSLVA